MPSNHATSRRTRSRLGGVALGSLAILALLGVAAALAPSLRGSREQEWCTIELRSWVVMGRGRHLYAQIIPPDDDGASTSGANTTGAHSPGSNTARSNSTGSSAARSNTQRWPADLPLIVEYWSTALRDNYTPPADPERGERIARMALGHRVRPSLVTPPDNRLEATYKATFKQARELARDRVFERRYFLLGPNSTSGLRAAFESAGLRFPARALAGAGALGEFPGVDLPAGREIPAAEWAKYGLGSAPAPKALNRAGSPEIPATATR